MCNLFVAVVERKYIAVITVFQQLYKILTPPAGGVGGVVSGGAVFPFLGCVVMTGPFENCDSNMCSFPIFIQSSVCEQSQSRVSTSLHNNPW